MKKYILFIVILASAFAKAQDTPISAFLEKWENSKNYLLEMAAAMPEDKYDYKPTERQKTFRDQLLHIKSNMDWLSGRYFEKDETKERKEETYTTKAEVMKAITEGFDNTAKIIKTATPEELKDMVPFFAGQKTKLQILNLLQDHVTHHRGQLIVYLNLNGIKPPKYRGW
ncbi:DinB family protein [Kordia sp. YSTF-M3]|uniref:DinB family protein n=1 Tax=Kordia aestuariivivens TaxID=2759037 RepID=A0ABR7Q9I4_9FLAO|nr:DinB family protein [Kordia aestuariivivens]MBC8755236.1 DinB family protein [Kordia aestuariivivens]